MRIIDIRRHTMRRKPGQHLSREGIALARQVGDVAPVYDLVVTSTIARAIETAIAMGQEVHQFVEDLGHIPPDVHTEIDFPSTFFEAARVVAARGPAARFASRQAQIWQAVVEQVPDGGRALIVTHGLFIECGAAACLPDADHAGWGGAVGYCEGIELQFDGGWQGGLVLRVPDSQRLVEN